MKHAYLAAALALAATPALAGPMPQDTPISLDGTQTVCTGIGKEAQDNPRWTAYPIRIEFSNGGSQFVAGAHVVLKGADGKSLASLDCSAPWVLFRLTPGGDYTATASLKGDSADGEQSAHFTVPQSGQQRVVIAFPHLPANY